MEQEELYIDQWNNLACRGNCTICWAEGCYLRIDLCLEQIEAREEARYQGTDQVPIPAFIARAAMEQIGG